MQTHNKIQIGTAALVIIVGGFLALIFGACGSDDPYPGDAQGFSTQAEPDPEVEERHGVKSTRYIGAPVRHEYDNGDVCYTYGSSVDCSFSQNP